MTTMSSDTPAIEIKENDVANYWDGTLG